MARGTTILSCFFLGFGAFWLILKGFVPPIVGQIVMVGWVLLMRHLAMPAAVESALDKEPAAGGGAAGSAAPEAAGAAGGGKKGGASAAAEKKAK